MLEASFVVQKLSAIYETEPVGVENHGNFLNMAVEIHLSGITASQMMARMLRIEYLLGRKDKNLQKPRTVDLDLLLFGDTQTKTEFLTLPHPRMHLRRFVLTPLAEIAPHTKHPILNKNIIQLLDETNDNSFVKRWNPNHDQTFENDEMKIYFKNLATKLKIKN